MGKQVLGTRIEAEPNGATAVADLYLAGNLTDIQAQVVSSAAAGLSAGAAINADLIAEETKAALDVHHHELIYGERAWDERYRRKHRPGAATRILSW